MLETVSVQAYSSHKASVLPDISFKSLSSSGFSEVDMGFLAKLYATTRWDEVQQAPWSDQQRKDFLQQQFDAQHKHYQLHYPKAHYLLIIKEKQAIGRVYLDRDDQSVCLIDIALLPEFKYHGLGTLLLKELLLEAQVTNKKIVIHVEKFNPAYQWYLKNGFKQVEDKGVHQYMEWYPQANKN
ncbi:MAG: GNAT family N-acetyltransferase [Alcanivoracaceae bacterium]|nr:GNAT family N-acetyltransferase [Alcanivoracaceae bacterium]